MEFWDIKNSQPTWVWNLIIGGIAGYLIQVTFPLILVSVRYIISFLEKSSIEGAWHAYHWSYKAGKPVIIASYMVVKKGFRNPFIAYLKQDTRSKLAYKATITREKSHFLFNFKSLNHAENVIVRFPEPLGNDCDRLYGIWLAYDHDQNIASGGILLSRQELNDNLEYELRRGFDVAAKKPLNRLKAI